MNVDTVIKKSIKVLESQNTHRGYMLDAEGKEVQITTAMVRTVCQQLLKQCRNIKN
ncbi:PA1571 family protein [Acinetobacter sp. ANC 4558]|uniref:PA1571 family protein n=1 Tax=Acinetobacter sp. ANC 4558 TaxID=1977876 RepID=UPI000A33E4C2|nr:PA1571 family protein [Acinetobacter sp. ANC 4558]